MAELSKFLNGGKVLKVVSAGSTSISNDATWTLTPAADQYVRFYARAESGAGVVTIVIGGNTVLNNAPLLYFDADWMGGKGEAVSVTEAPGVNASTILISYQILEEDN